jgi:tetratricopeptide (TPR) repeat protein
VALAFPFGLELYSSEKHFKRGKEFLSEGNIESAVDNFDLSIKDLGLRNKEAAEVLCYLSIYRLQDYTSALNYATIGIKNSHKNTDLYTFHYLKGLAFKKLKKYESSREEFLIAKDYNTPNDSILVELADMEIFVFEDFNKAKTYLNALRRMGSKKPEILYYSGYLHYRLDEFNQSIHYLNRYLEQDSLNGMAFYLSGMARLKLKKAEKGCEYLKKAYTMGFRNPNPIINTYCGIE